MSDNASHITARALLDAGAFLIRPQAPFRLTSGLLAPFYINCRLILGHAQARTRVADALAEDVAHRGGEIIAGGVTAGVPFATLVADRLGLPLVYIRPQPKSHGTGGQIEGCEVAGRKVVLVEDLITTAASILLFTNALRVAEATIDHVSVVFARMTDAAQPVLVDLGLSLGVLCELQTLLAMALEEGVADAAAIAEVRAFLADPEAWSAARHGKG
jgi:orotate phosphoribosyltransferase